MAEITEEVDKTIYPTHQGGCGEEFGATTSAIILEQHQSKMQNNGILL